MMISNNDIYKGSDFLKEDFKSVMNSYFNPFEYNLESNLNYEINTDKMLMKSKNHPIRKNVKNK